EYVIEIIEAPYTEYSGFNIHPALDAASDEAGQPEPSFVKDSQVYSTNAFFPANIVEEDGIQVIRGISMAVIQIRPVQYNPVTGVIRVYSKIRYKLSFSPANNSFMELKYRNSDNFFTSMKNSVLNSDLLPKKSSVSTKSTNSADIILLTTPTYQAAADTLAQWKRQLGYSVKMISSNSWTTTAVMDSVHNLYNSMTPHPDYLIILGDQADVPAQQIVYSTSYYLTDLYYVCMDGTGDYTADMARGRISVSNTAQALEVVQKIVNYERNPVADPSFYSNIMSCAYFQDGSTYTSYKDGYADRRFLHTAEEIRSYLLAKNYNISRTYFAFDNRNPTNYNNGYYSDGQAIPSDLLISNGFNWTGNTTDLLNKLNAGAFIMYHRDHGYTDGYGWEHPYFLNQEASALVSNGNNINQLNNGNKLPVVFSINCHTGDFKRAECFAENFLRKGNGGAVGVFAPSYTSYSGYNDALITGLFDAIWSNPGLIPDFGSGGVVNPSLNAHGDLVTMGDVLNQGLLRMSQTWAQTTRRKMQNEIFHYFGDPSMKLWTSAPQTFSINNLSNVIRLDSAISLSISNCSDASYTLFINDTLFAMGNAVNGQIEIPIHVADSAKALLTIYKHNFRPIVKQININNVIKSIPPTQQASNIRFYSVSSKTTSLTVTWDKGDGDFSMVKISDTDYFTDPVDSVEYTADTYYGGSGEQVVFRGYENSVTVYNLTEGKIYWFRVYEYNNEGEYSLYQTIEETNNPNASDGGGLLPVIYTAFNGEIEDGIAKLKWVTSSEINNNYFSVEHSVDNLNFSEVGRVEGFGMSNIPVSYSFEHEDCKTGINYYRLKQVDYDGKFAYSQVVGLQKGSSEPTQLISFCNQAGANLEIGFFERNSYQIRLTNIAGKSILQKDIASDSETILPISELSPGVYLLTALSGDRIENQKIIINQ
ncbi:MAG: T9SS type A sorting domain-containing protein, partial [Bacteroidales bacterium]|nr:T9SS type A sorting domain-containing protein [Bacteroidales bacterium]